VLWKFCIKKLRCTSTQRGNIAQAKLQILEYPCDIVTLNNLIRIATG